MKIIKFLINTFLFVMVLLFLNMAINAIRVLPDNLIYHNSEEYFTIIILQLVVFSVLAALLLLVVKKKIYRHLWAWVIPFVVLVLIQGMFYLALRPLALHDTYDVCTEALRMVQEHDPHIGSGNGYFEIYGNNYPAVLFMYLYYSLLNLFSVKAFWDWTILLNVLCIDGAILLSCRFTYLLKGKKAAYLCLLLWVFHPYPYIYVSFAYTSTFSFILVTLELLMILLLYRSILSGEKRRAFLLSLSLGALGALSFLLRVTNLIVPIAAAVLLPAALLRCRKLHKGIGKCAWKSSAILLLSFLLVIGVYRIAENAFVSPELRAKNFPLQHWIAMGLRPESEGRFYKNDETEMYQLADREEKIALAEGKIRERLEQSSFLAMLLHMNRKLTHLWSDVANYYSIFLSWNTSYGRLYSHVAGVDSGPIIAYNQIFQLLLFILLLCGAMRHYWMRKDELSYLFLVMVIFGVNLFYMLWETSYRYSGCFMPIVFILAAEEMEILSEKKVRFYSKLPIALLILLLVIGSYRIPSDVNTVSDLRRYSIFSNLHRSYMRTQAEGCRLCQSFTVQKDKQFNRIDLYMETEDKNSIVPYQLSLYTAEGEQLLYRMSFIPPSSYASYYPLHLSETYGDGEYMFVLDQVSDASDTTPLRKIHNLFGDYNPNGMLITDGDAADGKWDLVFNVLMEE